MLKNHLKIAIRNLVRNKVTGFINIFGLALGIACCLLILMYVTDEKSYDQWLPDSERIYRVAMDISNAQGEQMLFAPTAGPLAPVLKDYPQVEQATRLVNPFSESVQISSGKDKIFYETGFYWADPNIFEVFPFEFLAGLPTNALQAPYDLVLTREMVEKYFSVKEDFGRLIGQSIKRDTTAYRITGVIENIPHNTSFKPDFIASLKESEGNSLLTNWHATVYHNFIKLQKGTDVQAFEQQIEKIADNYVGEQIKENQQSYTYFLQPLTDIHLHSKLRYEFSKNNSHQYVQIFGWVALFVLLLACINFINLTTAYAIRQAKEVGVRKAIGSMRSQLVAQFLTETLLTSTIAAGIALGLVTFALPYFNDIADKTFIVADFWSSRFVALLPIITLSVGLLAGIYPALVLSGFRPAQVLRGSFAAPSKGSGNLRSTLVVLQFAISIALIAGTVVLSNQVQYLKQQNLGFNQEQMLVVTAPRSPQLAQNYIAVRQEMSQLAGVNAVCITGNLPGKSFGNNLIFLQGDRDKSTDMQLMSIDEAFLDTYEIPLLAGRNLSENVPEDLTRNVLINEAALPYYGWEKPEEALGQTFDGGWGTVVGVVQNFHFNSLHKEVLPMEMFFSQRRFSYLTLNVSTASLDELLPAVKAKWTALVPDTPLDYAFLDETFNRQYRFEDRLTSLFKIFGGLAIFIACLGLFGLAAFAAERRTKEIGIRKVLGASVGNIVGLLSKDFLQLIVLSLLLATPLTWYFMENWLQDFAYRISVQWWVFALAGVGAISIAFLTVGYQSIKAALVNPIHSLKSE